MLLETGTSFEIRDEVWRQLIGCSRQAGGQWTLAVVGMAAPMLKRLARIFADRYDGHGCDLASEVLAGSLDHLATMDLDRQGVAGRLRCAGRATARRRKCSWPRAGADERRVGGFDRRGCHGVHDDAGRSGGQRLDIQGDHDGTAFVVAVPAGGGADRARSGRSCSVGRQLAAGIAAPGAGARPGRGHHLTL